MVSKIDKILKKVRNHELRTKDARVEILTLLYSAAEVGKDFTGTYYSAEEVRNALMEAFHAGKCRAMGSLMLPAGEWIDQFLNDQNHD